MDLPEWWGGARTHSRAKRGVEFGEVFINQLRRYYARFVIAVMIFIDDE